MATDYAKLTENLTRFYDFTGKTVLYVGAGRKQLLDSAIRTAKIVAVDQDVEALRELQAEVTSKGLHESVQVVGASFETIRIRGDVVYFEFCLHEMVNPLEALTHARKLAPDIVVYDHSPGSEWAYHAVEEDKVRRSAETMERFGIRRQGKFVTEQRFANFDELLAKVSVQGAMAVERAQHYAGSTKITIPMKYELALL